MVFYLAPNQSIMINDIQNYLYKKTGIQYENINKTI